MLAWAAYVVPPEILLGLITQLKTDADQRIDTFAMIVSAKTFQSFCVAP
jgi:hypothetical protein